MYFEYVLYSTQCALSVHARKLTCCLAIRVCRTLQRTAVRICTTTLKITDEYRSPRLDVEFVKYVRVSMVKGCEYYVVKRLSFGSRLMGV